MEEKRTQTLGEFLKEYEIDAKSLTDKEKIKVLRNIILHHTVDKDLVELKYSKVLVTNKKIKRNGKIY